MKDWLVSVTTVVSLLAIGFVVGFKVSEKVHSPKPKVIFTEPTSQPVKEEIPFEDDAKSASVSQLVKALMERESTFNPRAEGDPVKTKSGKIVYRSKGVLQIQRRAWQDACEYGKVHWDYGELVWSIPHSQQVLLWYWEKYGAVTNEERARIWNGGPKGMTKKATISYWRDVCAILKAQKAQT